jgi:hypothetical protein
LRIAVEVRVVGGHCGADRLEAFDRLALEHERPLKRQHVRCRELVRLADRWVEAVEIDVQVQLRGVGIEGLENRVGVSPRDRDGSMARAATEIVLGLAAIGTGKEA